VALRDSVDAGERVGMRAGNALAFVGALDEGVADQILDEFELALSARQPGRIGPVLSSFTQRAAERTLARQVSARPAAAGMSAAARSGTGMAPRGRTRRFRSGR